MPAAPCIGSMPHYRMHCPCALCAAGCLRSRSMSPLRLLACRRAGPLILVVVAAQICVPCAPYLLARNTCPPPPCVRPQKRYLIAGGGSPEMELSYQLSQYAKTLVVRGWAALAVLPGAMRCASHQPAAVGRAGSDACHGCCAAQRGSSGDSNLH